MRISAPSLLGFCTATTVRSEVTTETSRYLKFPVFHSDSQSAFEHDILGAGRGVKSLDLANRSDIAYYARLDFGTPPQPQYVLLDTGSFELWVNPDCRVLASDHDKRFCRALGQYNASASSTAVSLGSNKFLQYGIGNVTFEYFTDTVGIKGYPDTRLREFQFGVAKETRDEFSGVLGLGYGKDVATKYHNFIDQLFEQGVTETKAFSLALGSKTERQGLVMFGGIDTGKFSGALKTLPVIPPAESPDGAPRYWVELDKIGLSSPSRDESKVYEGSQSLAVFLDSGSTMTLLPRELASRIAADFGGDEPNASGEFVVDCKSATLSGTINFVFDGLTIRVPRTELVREHHGSTSNIGKTCYLGIGASDRFVSLGDSMLRSAYVVFDQTNNAIHLAQYINCGRREVEITTNFDFASAQGDCSLPAFDSMEQTSTGNPPSSAGTAASGSGFLELTRYVNLRLLILGWTMSTLAPIWT